MDFSWTDEPIADARRLYGDGKSATDIKRHLNRTYAAGLSRAAVCGKLNRLGLKRGKKSGGPKKGPRPASVFFTPHLRRMAADQPEPAPPEPMPFTGDPAEVPLEQRRTLLDLTNETCRYPYGDPHEPGFFFCASPTADCRSRRPYCSAHAAVVYSRPGKPVSDEERDRLQQHGHRMWRIRAQKRAAA